MKLNFKAKSEDTRNFIKIKSGERIQGVFRGDPYDYRNHWLEKDQRSVLCEGHLCPICQAGVKSTFRFRMNFIVRDQETGEYVAKIFEGGYKIYGDLKSLQDDGYDLEKQIYIIKRHGEKLNTSWSVNPSPAGVITPEQEKKIALVKLNDLGHLTDAEKEPLDTAPIPAAPQSSIDEDIPF